MNISKLDEDIYSDFNHLPRLAFYNTIKQDKENLIEQKNIFFKEGGLPSFTYSFAQKIETDDYLRQIKIFKEKINSYSVSNSIKLMYTEKCSELETRANLIKAIQQKNDELVTKLSETLFGIQKETLTELNLEFQKKLKNAVYFFQHSKPITAELFEKMVINTLRYYKITNWKTKIYQGNHVSIIQNKKNNTIIRIPKNLSISKSRAKKLLTHEIEVHVLRTYNGSQSSLHILQRGLGGYLPTEEGLAIYFQNKLNPTAKFLPAFWGSWTCALSKEGNFTDVFNTLYKAKLQILQQIKTEQNETEIILQAKNFAWNLCVRNYKGIHNLEKHGVGFLKNHIYRTGYLAIVEALKNDDTILPMLFSGNIGLKDLDTIKEIEVSPGKIPCLISPEILKNTLADG